MADGHYARWMAILRLKPAERAQLEAIAAKAKRAREVKRAQALIWLADGVAPTEVGKRVRMSRQGVYLVAQRFRERQAQPIAERLQDAKRAGRPAAKMNRVLPLLKKMLPKGPQAYGYRAACWTVPMLQTQLETQLGLSIGDDLIRLALKRLRYRYKRPRFVLARRSPTWRQAKGGSSAG